MTQRSPFRYFKTSPIIIRLAVMLYIRFPLSLRNVEDLLHERGIDITHESVRFWWNKFGAMFAAEIRRRRVDGLRACKHWRWHLDEVYVKTNGMRHYLWRAVDHEGEVFENFVTKTRDKKAALKFLKKSMKRHGRPESIVTDRLRCYGAALKDPGRGNDREMGALAQQPGREFAPAVPTTRACDVAAPEHTDVAEVRLSPCLGPQPLSDETPSPRSRRRQDNPRCRSR
jgi:putative transposase